jgi:hypothetical protein
MTELQRTANFYYQNGLTVLPLSLPDGTKNSGKQPLISWKDYAEGERVETHEDVNSWFSTEKNIGNIAGECSGNLTILDFDSFQAFKGIREKSAEFRKLIGNTWVIQSGRGIHVYARTDFQTQKRKIKEIGLDVQGHGSYCVAPPSLHWRGGQYCFSPGVELPEKIIEIHDLKQFPFLEEWIIPWKRESETNSTFEAFPIEENRGTYGLGAFLFNCLLGKWDITHPLYSQKIAEYAIRRWPALKDGPAIVNRSDMEFSIILRLVATRKTASEVYEIFRRYSWKRSKFRESFGPEKYIQGRYDAAVKQYAGNMSKHDKQIQAWEAAIPSLPWNSRTRATDQAVFRAVLHVALYAGTFTGLDLQSRKLKELAGMTNHNTVENSINRQPYVKREQGGGYTLETIPPLIPPTHVLIWDVNYIFSMDHDLFMYRGLGKIGFEILRYMGSRLGEYVTLNEISEALQYNYRTIYNRAGKLNKVCSTLGIERGKKGKAGTYCLSKAPSREALDAAARILGTYGDGERMKRLHDEERAQYREHLQARRSSAAA